MVKLGDRLVVKNSGRGYSAFTRHIENHYPEWSSKFVVGALFSNGEEVIVIGLKEHEDRSDTTVALVLRSNDTVGLINLDGLSKPFDVSVELVEELEKVYDECGELVYDESHLDPLANFIYTLSRRVK